MPSAIASRQAENVATETRALLDERDVATLAVTALSAAGGVIVAQTVADTVLEAVGLNPDPQGVTDYAGSVTVKALVAVGFGFLASSLGGLGLVAAGFMAVGALASAGADAIEALLTTSPLGSDNPLLSGTHMGDMGTQMRNAATGGASARVVSTNTTTTTSSTDPDEVEFRESPTDEFGFR